MRDRMASVASAVELPHITPFPNASAYVLTCAYLKSSLRLLYIMCNWTKYKNQLRHMQFLSRYNKSVKSHF